MKDFDETKELKDAVSENNEGVATYAAESADAGKEEKAATAYGKFANAQALLSAYLELEAEFTRRSQRLRELEGGNKARSDGAPSRGDEDGGDNIQPESGGENNSADGQAEAAIPDGVRRAVIEEYLKGVASGRSAPVLAGGIGLAAPKNRPKTVNEAGRLARQFLDR